MSEKKNRRGQILAAVYVLLLGLTILLIVCLGGRETQQTQKIGFILSGRAEGQGAYEGVRAACQTLGVELLLREQVGEEDGSCPRAVEELAQEGAEMVILTSSSHVQEMQPLYSEYPAVTFYGIFASAVSADVPNLTSYSTRMYQARYLSGIVAGMYSRGGTIGFVATERTSEVCRNINAFALGVRRANPEAEVVVAWAGPEEDAAQAARTLIREEGVDVITYHQNQDAVLEQAELAGVASIGYYTRADGLSERYLTSAVCDWTMLYEQLIREYLRGQTTGSVVNEWLGLESGAVGLTRFSPLVSAQAAAEVDRAKEEILSGRDVFTNEIRDNRGVLRCEQGESMTDETLLRGVDWLAEGVRVYE